MHTDDINKKEHEKQLIARLKLGDEAAMKLVFQLYYARLHYYSTQLIDQAADAEDIVQEAFLNFWLNIKEKEVAPENIQAYLFRMVRNRCLNHLERQQMLAGKTGEMIKHYNDQLQQQMNDLMLKEAVYHRVSQELVHLTPVQAQVIKLMFIEGLSVSELAERLQTTANNIRNHKARALDRLKTVIKDDILIFMLIFLKIF